MEAGAEDVTIQPRSRATWDSHVSVPRALADPSAPPLPQAPGSAQWLTQWATNPSPGPGTGRWEPDPQLSRRCLRDPQRVLEYCRQVGGPTRGRLLKKGPSWDPVALKKLAVQKARSGEMRGLRRHGKLGDMWPTKRQKLGIGLTCF